MTKRIISLAIILSSALAFVACKGDDGPLGGGGTGGGGSGGSGGATTTSSTGGTGGTGDPIGDPDCECACGAGTPAGLVCNDSAHPSFCAGVAPVPGGMCEKALIDCGYSADDIAALGCN